MKQGLLVVNALLVIAVSYLLYKQFSANKVPAITAANSLKGDDSAGQKKILFAYINMDSIQVKYELAKATLREVEKRREGVDNELKKMENSIKTKLDGYQQRASAMTEEEAIAAREDMDKSQRNFMDRKMSLEEDFGQWLQAKNMSVMKDIQDYLKSFNADGTYSFIFSYEPGLFYYSDTTYDITSQVIKGLNEQYKAKKK